MNVINWAIQTYAKAHEIPIGSLQIRDVSLEQISFDGLDYADGAWSINDLAGTIHYSPAELLEESNIRSIEISQGEVAINLPAPSTSADKDSAAQKPGPPQNLASYFDLLPLLQLDLQGLEVRLIQQEQTFEFTTSAQANLQSALKTLHLDLASTLGSLKLTTEIDPLHSTSATLLAQIYEPRELIETLQAWAPELFDIPELESLNISPNTTVQVDTTGKLDDLTTFQSTVECGADFLEWEHQAWSLKTTNVSFSATAQASTPNQLNLKGGPWSATYESTKFSGEAYSVASTAHGSESATISWTLPIVIRDDAQSMTIQASMVGEAEVPSLQQPTFKKMKASVDVSQAIYQTYTLAPFTLKAEATPEHISLNSQTLKLFLDSETPALTFEEIDIQYALAPETESSPVKARFSLPSDTTAGLLPGLDLPPLTLNLQSSNIFEPETTQYIEIETALKGPENAIGIESPLAQFTGSIAMLASLRAPEGFTGDWHLKSELAAQGQMAGDAATMEDIELSLTADTVYDSKVRSSDAPTGSADSLLSQTQAQLQLSAQNLYVSNARAALPQLNMTLSSGRLDFETSSVFLSGDWPLNTEDFSAYGHIDLNDLTTVDGQANAGVFADNTLLELAATVQADLSQEEPDVTVSLELEPFLLKDSDIISQFLPEYSGTTLSGAFGASSVILIGAEPLDASIDVEFDSMSFNYPATGVTGSGIAGQFQFESIRAFTGQQDHNRFRADTISFGDIASTNWDIRWDWAAGRLARVNQAGLEILGGHVSLLPASMSIQPLTIESALQVEDLDLAELGRLIESFDGRLEGRLEGKVPFTFRNGSFIPREATMNLPDGEFAKLYYNSKIFRPDSFGTGTTGDWVLEKLDLQPQKIINDALADLTVDKFEMALFSKNTPEIPLKINISGSGRSGDLEVPINLDIPIRGSLTAFYNFLIRLSSMSPTIE
ncbi:MAG: intermembrane phospholipid transport protein YdbH family protein [Opitutales bacterium]